MSGILGPCLCRAVGKEAVTATHWNCLHDRALGCT